MHDRCDVCQGRDHASQLHGDARICARCISEEPTETLFLLAYQDTMLVRLRKMWRRIKRAIASLFTPRLPA